MALSNEVTEEVVHHCLKCHGRIGEAKEHNKRFEKTTVGTKGGFLFITILDVYVIVTPMDIQLGKNLGVPKFIDKFGDERKRVSIFDGYEVQFLIILDMTEMTIFLFYEEERGSYGRL